MIDAEQNITLNKAEDWLLPFRLRDPQGNVIDISGDDILLTVAGGFTLVPGTHPTDIKGRAFHFTKAHAASLTRAADYKVVRTVNAFPQEVFGGRISSRGF